MYKTTAYDKYDDFIKRYEELCIKTGITISYECNEGGFILGSFKSENIDRVKQAKRE